MHDSSFVYYTGQGKAPVPEDGKSPTATPVNGMHLTLYTLYPSNYLMSGVAQKGSEVTLALMP